MKTSEAPSSKHLKLQRILGSHHLKPQGQTRGFCMCPDNKSFWSLSSGLFLWDATTGEQLDFIDIDACSMAIDDDSLLVMTEEGLFRVKGQEKNLLLNLDPPPWYHKASFSRDASLVLFRHSLGHQLWSKSTGYYTKTWNAHYAYLLPEGDGVLLFHVNEFGMNKSAIQVESLQQIKHWQIIVDDRPNGAAFLSPNKVVISSFKGILYCIDLSNGKMDWKRKLSQHPLNTPVTSKKQHIAVDDGKTIFLIEHGEVQSTISDLQIRASEQIAISPEGDWLVVYEQKVTLRIFDLPSKNERLSGGGHTSKITGLSWLNSEKLLSIAEHDKQVRLWDTKAGQTTWLAELPKDKAGKLALSPDGKSFCVAYSDGFMEQRDLDFGSLLLSYRIETLPTAFTFSRGGAFLFASAKRAGVEALYAWEMGKKKPRWVATGGRLDLSLSKHDTHLWAFSARQVTRYEVKTGKSDVSPMPSEYKILHAAALQDDIAAVGFVQVTDQDGGIIANWLCRWTLDTGSMVWSQRGDFTSPICVSPSEKWLLHFDSIHVFLHSLLGGSLLDRLYLGSLNDSISELALSPDEKTVAVGTSRGLILLYDLVNLP
jgi:WD40 repeat protein